MKFLTHSGWHCELSNVQTPAILGKTNNRAVSLFDRTHRASFTYVYEIPFFREQRGALGHILGGFQISGVTTFESGVPFTISNGVDADGINGSGGDRPNLNPNGQRGVRAVPVVAPATLANGSPNPNFGRITGYINTDQQRAN